MIACTLRIWQVACSSPATKAGVPGLGAAGGLASVAGVPV